MEDTTSNTEVGLVNPSKELAKKRRVPPKTQQADNYIRDRLDSKEVLVKRL